MSQSQTSSVVVHGLCTELVVQLFADRILVLVTQMGKVGNLIQASIPSTTDLHAYAALHDSEPLPPPHPAIQLTPIFGSAPSAHMQTLYSLYAAHIATLVWTTVGSDRSVVVGIALERDAEEQQTFHGVMQALRAMLK